MTSDLGPYMNDDGDWWVPTTIPYLQARALVIGLLDYEIPVDGTLVYRGKGCQWLDSEHEAGCGDECPNRRRLLAYHWEENRKW